MGKARSFVGTLLGAVLVASGLTVAQATTASAATTLVADWQLNEPAGATVMVDGTGHHNGAIDPTAAVNGLTSNGSYYDWSLRCPTCPPAALPRIVQVPDSSELEIPDASVTLNIELRFKTPKGYGNILQKGQATDTGGQIKIENPNGLTQCVYIGASGVYVAVASPTALNDNKWHVVRCVHTSKQVQIWVDGVQAAAKNANTGPINNTQPLVMGGKLHCDNIKITCDYYTGDVDYVRIWHGDGTLTNSPPTASFTSSCSGLTCTFDGSASSDPEGQALTYKWDFGDGASSTAVKPSHAYATAGSYNVTLTVTDPGGLTGTLTRSVSVGTTAASAAFRAAASSNGNAITPTVTIPTGVQAGDALLLLASTNRLATMTTPSGWTLLKTQSDDDIKSWAFTRKAPTGAAGSTVTVTLDAYSKTSLTLLAYSGAGTVTTVASAAETSLLATTTHKSPSVSVAVAGSLVVSSWVDKSGTDHGWTLPSAVTLRNASVGTGAGAMSAATGDSKASVGTWAGLTATSGVASTKEISWSIVIPPA